MLENKLLIVTVNDHPALGPLLIPYWVRQIADGVLEAEEKAVSAKDGVLSEPERKIIALAQCYTEKNLMKFYSKEKTIPAFLRSMSEPEKRRLVRDYIERKHQEIIELIRSSSIPVYKRETATKQLYPHHRIHLYQELAEAFFHFELNETTFRYSVDCRIDGQCVSLLKKKPIQVLCTKPAVLVAGTDLLVFTRIEMPKLNPFLEKAYVEVPASNALLYMKKIVLPTMMRYPVSAIGFALTEERRECVAVLSVISSVLERPVVELHFRYDEQTFTPQQKALRCYPRLEETNGQPAIRFYARDLLHEKECVLQLIRAGFTQISDAQFTRNDCVSEYALADWINDHREELEPWFQLDGTTGPVNSYFVGDISLKQDITDTPDWFEIRITVQIGIYTFPFVCFRKHIREGSRRFNLPDGQIALLPEEWFDKYNDLLHYGEEAEGAWHIKKMHLGLVEQLTGEADLSAPRQYVPKEQISVPPRIRATLRSYQQDGFSWLVHLSANGLGGCLADDMGLGKTLQTIALLQQVYDPSEPEVRKQPEVSASCPAVHADPFGQLSLFGEADEAEDTPIIQPVRRSSQPKDEQASLIVVPTSLLSNWKREIARFSSLQICEYAGEKRGKELCRRFSRYHLVLTTYGLMRRDIDLLENYRFKYIILDESQNIKNPESQSYHSVMRLKSDNRLVLTGTPIENSLKDLWAQFNFINPGLLGSVSDFRNRFITPIAKEGNQRTIQRLQQLIRPFILRRTKEQVAPELPPLTEEVIYCEMTDEQQHIYTKEKNALRNSLLEEWHKNKIVALNGITRLRQLANHPRMVPDYMDYTGSSGKIEQVAEAYETLMSEGHKVLIFSSFVTHLKLLAEIFDSRGWTYAMLTGSTTDREEEIARFSSRKEVPAFFISLKAGGVGLNLTEADYVFILDPWWNPAAEMQAESRAHRIGQNKQVFVYRFITTDSIEEKIRILQERKSTLSAHFITENDPLEQLTDEEWRDLL